MIRSLALQSLFNSKGGVEVALRLRGSRQSEGPRRGEATSTGHFQTDAQASTDRYTLGHVIIAIFAVIGIGVLIGGFRSRSAQPPTPTLAAWTETITIPVDASN